MRGSEELHRFAGFERGRSFRRLVDRTDWDSVHFCTPWLDLYLPIEQGIDGDPHAQYPVVPEYSYYRLGMLVRVSGSPSPGPINRRRGAWPLRRRFRRHHLSDSSTLVVFPVSSMPSAVS